MLFLHQSITHFSVKIIVEVYTLYLRYLSLLQANPSAPCLITTLLRSLRPFMTKLHYVFPLSNATCLIILSYQACTFLGRSTVALGSSSFTGLFLGTAQEISTRITKELALELFGRFENECGILWVMSWSSPTILDCKFAQIVSSRRLL